MKAKVNFDIDKLKQFGIEHGEKFALAAAVLILGVFVVKAASHETLSDNLSPKAISDTSQTATNNVNHSPTPPPEQDVQGVDQGVNFVERIGKEPAQAPLALKIPPIDEEAFPDPVKRADPTLYPIEELRVAEFRGGIPTIAANGGNVQAPVAVPAPVAAPVNPAPAPAFGNRIGGRPGRPVVQNRKNNPARPAPALSGAGLLPLGGANVGAQANQVYPAGMPGPQGTGAAEGHYGIVVTGLIPVQKQREQYVYRFKNARRSASASAGAPSGIRDIPEDSDSPRYVWCLLERTDTTDGKTIVLNFGDYDQMLLDITSRDPTLQASMKALRQEHGISGTTMNQLRGQQAAWGTIAGEVVAAEYLNKFFSLRLPPVLLRDWGPEAAHVPQIPLAGAAASVAQPAVALTKSPLGAPAPGGFDELGGAHSVQPALPANGLNAEAVEIPYKLFRFVDLDVESGHSYRYRARLLLRNPNFGLEPQVLNKPETASVAYNATPWSETSPTILLPQNMRLLADGIEHPKHPPEPKPQISVFTFDPVQAVELIKEFDTELGALVGTTVPDQTIKNVADPVKRQVHDMTADFRTPAVLLDFRGNEEKLPGPGDLTDPAEMLLLDDVDHPENPRLIVINEAKDKPIVDHWTAMHIPPGAPPAANGLAPGAAQAPAGPAKGGNLFQPGGGGLLPNTRRQGNH